MSSPHDPKKMNPAEAWIFDLACQGEKDVQEGKFDIPSEIAEMSQATWDKMFGFKQF